MFFFVESRKFLLYARQIEIRGVDIDNPYYNYIISFTVPDIDNVTAVDYDAVEHRIYWSDVRTQTIKRAFINGTGVETVVSAGWLISFFLLNAHCVKQQSMMKTLPAQETYPCVSHILQTFLMLMGWQ